MIRGTTPTHTFVLPFDTANVKECMIIYGQDDKEVLRKEASVCTMSDNKIVVELTQEDTLKFDCKKNVQLQLRVLTQDDKALATKVQTYPVHKCLNSEVLSNDN